MPPIVMAWSLPITWAATCVTTSGITGLTVPGMIDEPFWSSGGKISAEAGRRAGAEEAQVVGDLGEADGNRLPRAGGLDETVARSLALERVGRRGDGEAGFGDELRADAGRALGVRVQAGADGGG